MFAVKIFIRALGVQPDLLVKKLNELGFNVKEISKFQFLGTTIETSIELVEDLKVIQSEGNAIDILKQTEADIREIISPSSTCSISYCVYEELDPSDLGENEDDVCDYQLNDSCNSLSSAALEEGQTLGEEFEEATIVLPYHKQGLDFEWCLEVSDSIAEAFERHAKKMDAAAKHLRKIKQVVEGKVVTIENCILFLKIRAKGELVNQLVEQRLAKLD